MESPMAEMYLTQIYAEARRNTGWIKFVGILLIITGIPGAIVLVGLLNIWMGLVLLQAATTVEREGEDGLLTFVEKVGLYFRIYAVVSIVGLIIAAIAVAFAVFGVWHGLENSGIHL